MPRKVKTYLWKVRRMGGTETGYVEAINKNVARKKVLKDHRVLKGKKITLRRR
jgi:hypothetical protein